MDTFERIKKLAKKNGMSLQIVAEKSGIGINTIYKWKNYDPKGTDLAKVAKRLHTTTDYLLCNTDDPRIPDKGNSKDGLSWSDLGMPYGGSIPDDLKGYYKVMAEQYVKEHPDLFNGDDKNVR